MRPLPPQTTPAPSLSHPPPPPPSPRARAEPPRLGARPRCDCCSPRAQVYDITNRASFLNTGTKESAARGALRRSTLLRAPMPRRQVGRGRALGARQRSRHHAGRQQNRPVGPKVRIRETALLARRLKTRARRQVSVEEGEAKAQQDGLMFIETSAKAGFNIKARSNPAARARARSGAPGSRRFARVPQALFRKLATALPGMESVQLPQKSALVDIKLSTPAQTPDGSTTGASSCSRC